MRAEELLEKESAIPLGDGTLYRILVNEKTAVHVRSFLGDPFFYLYAQLGAVTESEVLKKCMEESLFNQSLYFAYHRRTTKLVLMAALDGRIVTREHYEEMLQQLVSALSHWKTKLDEAPPTYAQEDVLKLMSQKKRIFFI